jgi:hypothetical protein
LRKDYFDHIIQVFDLPNNDGGAVCLMVAVDRCGIGFTAVNGDGLGAPGAADRLRQQPERRLLIPGLRQQKVNGLTILIHGAVQIAPLAFDPDVRLVHAPAAPHQPLAVVKCRFQRRALLQHPAVNRGMVDRHAALLHECFDMTIA